MVKRSSTAVIAGLFFAVMTASPVSADDQFNKLIEQAKYKDAVDYADNSIPPQGRTAEVWVKLGEANESLGLTEKALACYLVSWRLNPTDYKSLLGAAKIYNKLGQSENGLNMAKKALEQSFTGEASWEYARACIALNRAAEAKKALEKVIELDPNNVVANRAMGEIYFTDKQYDKAVALLKKSYQNKKDGETALKIGQSYRETGVWDSAMAYIKTSIDMGIKRPEVTLSLARIYYEKGSFAAAAENFDKAIGAEGYNAKDYYARAVAKEKNNDKRGANEAYLKAVSEMGSAKDKDAITARLRVATAAMEDKRFGDAIPQLVFINDADKGSQIVPDIYFMLADCYQAMKDIPKAISSLEKAIALTSKNVEAYARLADLYEKSGMAAKAKTTYETMMALSPGDSKVYLILAQYNMKSGKYEEALKLFIKGDSITSSAESKQGIAICAANQNKWNMARQAAKDALAKDGSLLESRKILAEVYMRSKEYQDAKDHIEFLAQKEPGNLKYWQQLAECYEGLKDPENMAKVDKRLADLDAKNMQSRLRLARYYQSRNDAKEASKFYEAVVALDSKNIEALKNLYAYNKAQGKKDEATGYLKQYLVLNPNDAESQRDLGDLLYEQKEFDGALSGYRMALKIDPNIKGFYKRYAEIVIKKGLQDEVIKALSALIASGDADLSSYTTLGMIYEQQKNYKKALEIYQKALSIDPQNADVLAALGGCQAANGDLNGAIISYEQSVMMNQKADKEFKALGDLYLKQGRRDEAMKAFGSYLDKFPSDTATAKSVGQFFFDKKQYREAVKYLGMVRRAGSTDAAVIFGVGAAAFYEGKFDSAVAVLAPLAARNVKPGNIGTIRRMLAESYEKLGKNSDAARMYAEYAESSAGLSDGDAAFKSASLQEQANPAVAQKIYEGNVRKFPRDYRNFVRLGIIYAQNKTTLTQAAATLKSASALADTIPQVWLELATVYGKIGKDEEELNAYRNYAKFDARNPLANKRIGLILLSKGKLQDAMLALETANMLDPGDVDVIIGLADGYLKTNRKNEAVDKLVKVKALKSGNLEIRYKLFQLFRDLGKIKEAEKEVSELIAMKRENKYLQGYAEVLSLQGKLKEAENAVEDILATDPENKDVKMLKGSVLKAQKRYDDAIEVFKEVSADDPNDARALYERAETYMLMSKVQWAETFYTRALRLDPKFVQAELGMARLERFRKNDKAYREHLENAIKIDPTNKDVLDEINRMKK